MAGAIGKDKMVKSLDIPLGNSLLAKRFKQRRDGVSFHYSLRLHSRSIIRQGKVGSR